MIEETKPLLEMLRESAVALQEAFPRKLNSLVVLTDTSAEAAYLSPDIADELSGNTHAIEEALNYAFPANQPYTIGLSDYNYHMATSVVKLIAIKEFRPGDYSPQYTREMESMAYFDHELAHLVGQYDDDHLGECTADAYAALRHIQLFGEKTDFFERHNQAALVVMGISPIHYTDPVLQRIKQLPSEYVASLSLQETVRVAGKIALQCQVSAQTLKKISDAFAPAKAASRKSLKDSYALVLSVMKENRNNPDIFEAGKRFFSEISTKRHIEMLVKETPDLQEVLDLIKQPVSEKKGTETKKQRGISPS